MFTTWLRNEHHVPKGSDDAGILTASLLYFREDEHLEKISLGLRR